MKSPANLPAEDRQREPLPAGRHGLSRAQVSRSQRTRLLHAVVEAVGEKGYAATTIADVAERADVSKKTFYVYFDGKDSCFLAAYEAFSDYLLKQMLEAGDGAPTWRERYARGVRRYLELLAARPARTRALMLETLAAGPVVLKRRRAVLKTWTDHLRQLHAQARSEDRRVADVPPRLFAITVGGIDELLREHIAGSGRIEHQAELAALILQNFDWLLRVG
ncbi:MAG TPA: TetR/AcrR family transcriptional regulator [Nevskiaceae bacterium]|nr:TetR/AcrR family transcriptional regulator [Nevskiaceae bacterium]